MIDNSIHFRRSNQGCWDHLYDSATALSLLAEVTPTPAPDCDGIGTRDFSPLALQDHGGATGSRELLLSCVPASRRHSAWEVVYPSGSHNQVLDLSCCLRGSLDCTLQEIRRQARNIRQYKSPLLLSRTSYHSVPPRKDQKDSQASERVCLPSQRQTPKTLKYKPVYAVLQSPKL